MNWDALGAVAEMVGALAVLATLIYLAWQVRDGREELRKSVQQNRQMFVREYQMELVRNDKLSASIIKARANTDTPHASGTRKLVEACGLELEEAFRLNAFFLAQWVNRVETMNHLELLTDAQKRNFENQLVQNYSAGIEAIWFEALRASFGETADDLPFFRYYDRVSAEQETSS